jgi:hypothetical protein
LFFYIALSISSIYHHRHNYLGIQYLNHLEVSKFHCYYNITTFLNWQTNRNMGARNWSKWTKMALIKSLCLWFIQYITIKLSIIYICICCAQLFQQLALLSCTFALIDYFIISLLRLVEAFMIPYVILMIIINGENKQNKNLSV